MIISADEEKAFNKILHPFTLKKGGGTRNLIVEKNFLNLIKIISKTLHFSTDDLFLLF